MLEILNAFKDYGPAIGVVGAALAFVFSVIKFWLDRSSANRWREFEVYHALIKELVEPPYEGGSLYLDRQGAILYELRHFKRYYPYSLRMLTGLKEKWSKDPKNLARILDELNHTISYLEARL